MAAVNLQAPAQAVASGRRLLPLVVLATAVIYGVVVLLSVRHYGGNLSSLIGAGDASIARNRPDALGHHVIVFRHSNGYDGLQYYYVAGDPFMRHPVFRDAFRYQRIGYPLVVWAVSLGRLAWRPAAMMGVNLVAVLLVAYLSGVLILQFGTGASLWWALACAVNPSLIIAVQLDLAEPLAMALSLACLLLYLRRRIGWAALLLAAAMLTREVAILFILPLLVAEVGARRFRQAAVLCLTVVPYLIWQFVLLVVLGRAGTNTSESNFGLPLAGIRAVVEAARHGSLRSALVHQGSIIALALLLIAALVVAAMQIRRRYDVVTGGILAHCIAALFAAPIIWIAFTSAARVFGGLYPLTIIAFTRYRTRSFAVLTGWVVLLLLFTFVRLVAISPVQSYYLTP